MRKLIIVILVFFCFITVYAQEITLDFCVGTWKYENPSTGEEFIMKLRKTQYEIPHAFGGGMQDCLVGVYLHKKNGIILTDCMNKFLDNIKGNYFPIWITGDNNPLYLSIKDYDKKNGHGKVKIIGGSSRLSFYSQSPKQLRMVLKDDGHEGVYVDANDMYPLGTSLPTDIILTKIE